jgi:hypothetical protein
MQMAQVSSYVHSLIGSNPPNGKAPEGEKMQEISAVPDSLTMQSDSIVSDALNVNSTLIK